MDGIELTAQSLGLEGEEARKYVEALRAGQAVGVEGSVGPGGKGVKVAWVGQPPGVEKRGG